MVTTENRIDFTGAFIKNMEITDEDLKQDLYLIALETEQGDETDGLYFACLMQSFDRKIAEKKAADDLRTKSVSIGVCNGIPISVIASPVDLEILVAAMMRR